MRIEKKVVESKIFIRVATATVAVVLTVAAVPIAGLWGSLVTACYACMVYLLQQTFQHREAAGKVFYSFLFFGMASTVSLQTLVLLPVVWVLMALQLDNFSLKTFSSSVLGVLTPYWFIVPLFILSGNTGTLTAHLQTIVTEWQLPDYSTVTIWALVFFLLLLLTNIACAVYYYRTDTSENLHQKSDVNTLFTLSMFSAAVVLVQPHLLPYFIGMMIMGTSLVLSIDIQRWRS